MVENDFRKNIFSHTSSHAPFSSLESEDLAVHLYPGAVTIQGVLRRKTLLKEGKKPTVRFFFLINQFSHLLPLPSYKQSKMTIGQLVQVSEMSSALLIKI